LERIVNQYEVGFLERLELVSAKADQLNAYLFYTGTPDYFNQDLERFRRLTPGHLRPRRDATSIRTGALS
jgi:zinc protease